MSHGGLTNSLHLLQVCAYRLLESGSLSPRLKYSLEMVSICWLRVYWLRHHLPDDSVRFASHDIGFEVKIPDWIWRSGWPDQMLVKGRR